MTFNSREQSVAWHCVVSAESAAAESTSPSVPGAGNSSRDLSIPGAGNSDRNHSVLGAGNSGRKHSVLDTKEKEKERKRAKFIPPIKCGEDEEEQEEELFEGMVGVHDMRKYYVSDISDDDKENDENEYPWEDKKRRKDGKRRRKYKGLFKNDFENVLKKIDESGKRFSKVNIHADILKPLLENGIVKKEGWKNDVEKARKFKKVINAEMKSLQETGTFTQDFKNAYFEDEHKGEEEIMEDLFKGLQQAEEEALRKGKAPACKPTFSNFGQKGKSRGVDDRRLGASLLMNTEDNVEEEEDKEDVSEPLNSSMMMGGEGARKNAEYKKSPTLAEIYKQGLEETEKKNEKRDMEKYSFLSKLLRPHKNKPTSINIIAEGEPFATNLILDSIPEVISSVLKYMKKEDMGESIKRILVSYNRRKTLVTDESQLYSENDVNVSLFEHGEETFILFSE